jgi:hypothetical protein
MTRYARVTCESLVHFHEPREGKPDKLDGQPYRWSLELNAEDATKFVADVNEGRMRMPAYLGGEPWSPTKAWIVGEREVQEPVKTQRCSAGPFI